MLPNYFFIDGSALIAQVHKARVSVKSLGERKLNLVKWMNFFLGTLRDLHGGEYKRVIFYFANGDEKRVAQYVILPNFRFPGLIRDLEVKFCGRKISQSATFEKWYSSVPQKYKDFIKREKGVDIQICADALQLAGTGKLDRLFLLTNDSDFLPLCRTLKALGVNISLLALSDYTNINKELVQVADSYDVVPRDRLDQLFE